MITIVNRDCLEYMRGMESKSVDFVFYDPPYNAKKDYGIYKDNLDEREYKQWMTDVYREADRISRNGVSILVGSKLTRLFFEILPPKRKTYCNTQAGSWGYDGGLFPTICKPVLHCKAIEEDERPVG
jgi:site-specific DNA-adenine methylase